MDYQPLTPAVFYILLALAERERHGYGIMKQVAVDSGGRIEMGPGTLYGSIKRMLADRLIEETDERVDERNERRKYYRLTPLGKKTLRAELDRYRRALYRARAWNFTILGLTRFIYQNIIKMKPTRGLAVNFVVFFRFLSS